MLLVLIICFLSQIQAHNKKSTKSFSIPLIKWLKWIFMSFLMLNIIAVVFGLYWQSCHPHIWHFFVCFNLHFKNTTRWSLIRCGHFVAFKIFLCFLRFKFAHPFLYEHNKKSCSTWSMHYSFTSIQYENSVQYAGLSYDMSSNVQYINVYSSIQYSFAISIQQIHTPPDISIRNTQIHAQYSLQQR